MYIGLLDYWYKIVADVLAKSFFIILR